MRSVSNVKRSEAWNRKHHEQDEEAEAATTTTRGQPPAISLQDAAEQGDVAALAAHRQAQL